jgi:hypothetical protein
MTALARTSLLPIAGTLLAELEDGRRVLAPTANGYWLTVLPAIHAAARVVALNPDGQEPAAVKAVEP